MTDLYFQGSIAIFFAFLSASFISSIGSIEFYVFIKKPNRKNLIEFKNYLPLFLQEFYFGENSARIYGGMEKKDGISYLLERSGSFPSRAISTWFVFTFLLNFFMVRDLILNLENFTRMNFSTFINILGIIIVLATHVRVLFFGIKMKRG